MSLVVGIQFDYLRQGLNEFLHLTLVLQLFGFGRQKVILLNLSPVKSFMKLKQFEL